MIEKDLEYLIDLVKKQGIQPIMSLVIKRNDKFGYKVNEVNERIINLCQQYNVGYIEHENIKIEHLNAGGVHIANHYNHFFIDNLSDFFNYAAKNHF